MSNLITDKFSPTNSLKLFSLKEHFHNFVKLKKNQKLPKIILLTGEKGIGKFTLIFHFINYVLSLNSKHPYDYENLSIDKNNDSYKKILLNVEQNFNYIGSAKPNPATIENIRDIKKKFYKSSLNNLPRFTVLDDVELMNTNAANALLKLIEEPSIYDYFILINNKKQNIIETLRSRSIEIKVFLEIEEKNKIFNSLKEKFKIENNFLNEHLELTTPGMLVKFSDLLDTGKINEKDSLDNMILKFLLQFKKSKNTLCLDLIAFLIDIKFFKLTTENKINSLEILEKKNKLTNLLNQYRKFNLNNNTVLNQFKVYFEHAR
tara:strand:+ start:953 stop:1909 length:957 start_codon:yes stop_codon:yes gene_type:complete